MVIYLTMRVLIIANPSDLKRALPTASPIIPAHSMAWPRSKSFCSTERPKKVIGEIERRSVEEAHHQRARKHVGSTTTGTNGPWKSRVDSSPERRGLQSADPCRATIFYAGRPWTGYRTLVTQRT